MSRHLSPARKKVLDLLQQYPDGLPSRWMIKVLPYHEDTVRHSLRDLKKWGLVENFSFAMWRAK